MLTYKAFDILDYDFIASAVFRYIGELSTPMHEF